MAPLGSSRGSDVGSASARDEGVASWLTSVAESRQLSKNARAVIGMLAAQPRLGSYGSVREVAEQANVSVSAITRAAQQLGFAGWPALQEQLRATYLRSLSAIELIDHRPHGHERPGYAWLNRDRDNLNHYARTVDLDQLSRVAEAIAKSRRTSVTGVGSSSGIAQILAHTASIYGYDVRLLAEPSQVATAVSHLTKDDLMIVVNVWRVFRGTASVFEACFEQGVPVILLGDGLDAGIAKNCAEVVTMPTEAVGFSPSLTVVLSAVHAIVAELQAVDPSHSRRMVEQAERQWSRY